MDGHNYYRMSSSFLNAEGNIVLTADQLVNLHLKQRMFYHL